MFFDSDFDRLVTPSLPISMADIPQTGDSKDSQLARGGLLTYSIKVSAVVFAFAAQLLIARFLGKAGYGDYSFAVATFNFLVIFAVAGSDSAATRFIAQYQNSVLDLQRCLTWIQRRAWVFSGVILLGSLLVVEAIRQFDERSIWITTQIICIAIPFQVFSILRQGVLRGRQRPVLSVLPEGLIRPISTLIFVTTVLISGNLFWGKFSTVHAAWIFVMVSLVALASGHWLLRRELTEIPLSATPTETNDGVVEWRSMAWASMFSTMAISIHSQCDVWMLGLVTENTLVGPYAAAAKYAVFVLFGINALNTAMGPMLSQAVGDKSRLQALARRSVLLSFVLGFIVAIPLLCFPGFMLNLFGKSFDTASLPLRILVGANLFNVICGSVGLMLSMTGHHSTFMKILLSSMVLNIVLNATLIPLYQTIGAAVATAISVVFWNMSALIAVRQKIGIRPALGGLV